MNPKRSKTPTRGKIQMRKLMAPMGSTWRERNDGPVISRKGDLIFHTGSKFCLIIIIPTDVM